MAVLTWRNVDAPNFTPAMQGQMNAAQLLNSAFGGLREGLTDFQNDPISRSNALLSNAIKDQALNQSTYNFDRAQQGDAALDAATPILNQAAMLSQQGKVAEAQQLLQSNAQLVSGLRPDQLTGAIKGNQGIASTANQYTGDLFDLGTRMRDSATADKTKVFVSNLLENAASPEGFGRYLAENRSRMTPLEYADAQAVGSRLFPGLYGNTGGGSTGAVGPAASAIGGAVGSNALPVSALFPITRSSESGNRQLDSKGNPITSSAGAVGIMQVMPDTGPEAAKLAGLPWDEKRYRTDSDYNQKIGEAYLSKQFNDFGNNPALAWAAYNAGPGALRKALTAAEKDGNPDAWLQKLPLETRDYVTKNMALLGQQVPNVANVRSTSENAAVDLAEGRKRRFGTIADTYLDTVNDKTSDEEVVAQLKQSAQFKNVPQRTLLGAVQRIVQRGTVGGEQTVSAKEAANILSRNMVPSDDTTGTISVARAARNVDRLLSLLPGGKDFEDIPSNWAGGVRPNEEGISSEIDLITSGAVKDIAGTQRESQKATAQIAQYQAELDQVDQRYKDMVRRASAVPGLANELPALEARRAELIKLVTGLQNQVPATRRPTAKKPADSVTDALTQALSGNPIADLVNLVRK